MTQIANYADQISGDAWDATRDADREFTSAAHWIARNEHLDAEREQFVINEVLAEQHARQADRHAKLAHEHEQREEDAALEVALHDASHGVGDYIPRNWRGNYETENA